MPTFSDTTPSDPLDADEDLRSAINPYRLAELVADRPINWRNVSDEDAVFRRLLGMPRAELFSMRHRSPVFAGLAVTPERRLAATPRAAAVAGLRMGPQGLPLDEDLARVQIPNVSTTWLEGLELGARRRLVDVLLPAPDGDEAGGWEPTGALWRDPGDYIRDAIERTDPDQGAVGDCYFIAALASVAFTHPTRIHRCTDSGPHTIRFHTGVGGWKEYTVSEKVPVRESNHAMIYAKSTDHGEIWPAVYEKAYAQYRARTSSDRPNYSKLSGGSGTRALHHITGWPRKQWRCKWRSAIELYDLVRKYSVGRRTVWPMVADTYGMAETRLTEEQYDDIGLVDNHVYSVFGTLLKHGKRYIVLRNPWAQGAATADVATGTWEGMTLGAGGLFALRIETFQKYFQHLGVARP